MIQRPGSGRHRYPRLVQMHGTVGGEPPWRRCECGKWKDTKTGQHVEVETLSLKEALERWGEKCPDQANDDTPE